MITRNYDGRGVRFEYPPDWALEETDDGDATTIEIQSPDGLAFILVRTDNSAPDPAFVADEVLEAMREEYPDLEASPALESINGHHATGHDVEFFSLDATNAATIRSFRTEARTILVFGQWSDIGGDDLSEVIRSVVRTVEDVVE